MMPIYGSSLLSLEARAKVRKNSKLEAIAHRRRQGLQLGEHLTLPFEDERAILHQILETLHIENVFDEDGIRARSTPTRCWCPPTATVLPSTAEHATLAW